jgi:glucose-fructose oxidoreductase
MTISRKEFLKRSGLATASVLAFPSVIIPKKKEKLGVALVGLGYYSGGLLAPALQLTSACELKGIVTGTPSKIPQWQNRYGIEDKNVYSYDTMHEIANNEDIDILYIVTPSGLHGKYAIRAAESGKHVWCEKPMETTVDRCQAIIDAADKNKVSLTIGYRMQHEPNTQTIIRYGKEKPFGKIKEIIADAGFRAGHSRDSWRTDPELGGGALFDMGVYCINAGRYVTGEEPIAVSAEQITTRPDIYSEVDEEMHFEMEFPSGAVAKCKTSFARGMNDLQVSCDNGNYWLKPFQSYSGVRGGASDGTEFSPFSGNQQAKQMDDDAHAIKESTDVIVPGEEGLRDVRVVEAIFESVSKNGARVHI